MGRRGVCVGAASRPLDLGGSAPPPRRPRLTGGCRLCPRPIALPSRSPAGSRLGGGDTTPSGRGEEEEEEGNKIPESRPSAEPPAHKLTPLTKPEVPLPPRLCRKDAVPSTRCRRGATTPRRVPKLFSPPPPKKKLPNWERAEPAPAPDGSQCGGGGFEVSPPWFGGAASIPPATIEHLPIRHIAQVPTSVSGWGPPPPAPMGPVGGRATPGSVHTPPPPTPGAGSPRQSRWRKGVTPKPWLPGCGCPRSDLGGVPGHPQTPPGPAPIGCPWTGGGRAGCCGRAGAPVPGAWQGTPGRGS